MNHKFSSATFLAGLLVLCSSCGQPQNVAGDASPGPALVVTDAAGRQVNLARMPQRMSITGKASFMIENAVYLFPEARQKGLAFLGGQSLQRPEAGDFLSLIVPDHAARATLGGQAGIEEVAATRPDVVLMKSTVRQVGETMGQVGLPVVFLDLETPAQYERDLAILGQLLGAPESAQTLMAYYRGILDDTARRTASLSPATQPRTLLIQSTERNGTAAFSVPAPEWIQTELVERAGGMPVWKDSAQRSGWTVVNLEQIAAWDPEVVFVVNYHGNAARAVAAIRADSQWQALRAIRTNRIYAFPGDFCSWDQPDPRWGLGLLWLATRLQPALFHDVDLEAEILRFYALYGLSPDTVRSRILPLVAKGLDHAPR